LVYSKKISVETRSRFEFIDITSKVQQVVTDSGITDGIAIVFTVHTTTGLFINENESGLLKDIEVVVCKVVPSSLDYRHNRVDDNAPSHIQSVLLGSSLTIPVESSHLQLGTWQRIFFAERDGPRHRSVIVKVLGD